MNTDRDNFHDWARSKPDTAFGALPQIERPEATKYRAVRWGGLLMIALLGIALVVAFKLFAGL
ncbi:MAG: hypothetical protein WKG52_01790 [Variovorax sp.]